MWFAIAVVGLFAIGIGAFLPMWDTGSVSAFSRIRGNSVLQSGTGWADLVLAVIGAIAVVRAFARGSYSRAPLGFGLIAFGVALYDGVPKSSRTLCPLDATSVSSACEVAQPGLGIYAVGAGGIALFLAGCFLAKQPKAGVSPAPSAAAVRECPYCKEDMRRDASTCPHCRKDSPAWVFNDGLWWAHAPDGGWLLLDEPTGTWHAYKPPAETAPAQNSERPSRCPRCGIQLYAHESECPSCGESIAAAAI